VKGLLAVILVVAHTLVWAQDGGHPEDFAFGLELSTDRQAAVYRIPLPQDVYLKAVDSELQDVAVFNAAGESVPVSLRAPEVVSGAEGVGISLPFFPLYGNAAQALGGIGRMAAGDLNKAIRNAFSKPAAGAPVSAYLIDASGLERDALGALELDWEGPVDGLVWHLSVDASKDLITWTPLVPKASLAQLQFAGHRLSRTRIDLPSSSYRYLQLRWSAGEAPDTVVTKVIAIPRSRVLPVPRLWLAPAGERLQSGDSVVDEYLTHGQLRVDKLGLALPKGNVLAEARILSRPDDKAPWRLRYEGAFYRVETDGVRIDRAEVDIVPTTDRYWRVEKVVETFASNDGGGLRLGWTPQDLYFLGRGEGPYTLAYGAAVPPPRLAVDSVLERIRSDPRHSELVADARVSASVVLGGEARLQPPSPQIPWQRLALWAVLVAGVGLLGVMAWRLWRQMHRDEEGASSR